MNNMVPMPPNRQEVEFMNKTRNILEGMDNPQPNRNIGNVRSQRLYETQNRQQRTPIQPTYIPDDNYANVQAMKNIIESLDCLDDSSHINNVEQKRNTNQQYITEKTNNNTGNWEVTVSLNTRGARIYEVKDIHRNVFENIKFNVFESALATAKILNENGPSIRINELIELDEDFDVYRSEVLKNKRVYKKSISLNESESASVFNARMKKAQASATAIQEAIKDIYISL